MVNEKQSRAINSLKVFAKAYTKLINPIGSFSSMGVPYVVNHEQHEALKEPRTSVVG